MHKLTLPENAEKECKKALDSNKDFLWFWGQAERVYCLWGEEPCGDWRESLTEWMKWRWRWDKKAELGCRRVELSLGKQQACFQVETEYFELSSWEMMRRMLAGVDTCNKLRVRTKGEKEKLATNDNWNLELFWGQGTRKLKRRWSHYEYCITSHGSTNGSVGSAEH